MVYDYAIIGAGAAGLQLALAMSEDAFFAHKQIVLFDPDSKSVNDKTWCFWEKGAGKFDEIITFQWKTALFYGGGKSLTLPLGAFSYKMLRSIDFYEYAKDKLSSHPNIHWIKEEVKALIETTTKVEINAANTFEAQHVFDSRMTVHPADLKKSNGVLQHFLGWEIETEEEVFDTASFTMMDYRLKWPATTSFMYVLPTAKNKALLEFTFFSPDLAQRADYEKMLKKYIREILKLDTYEIKATEQGVIPMYDYPFRKGHTEKITKIGTAGGWVKASSGYSFKSSGKKCAQIIANIKSNKPACQGLYKKRHELYDATFLTVLEKENELGEALFTAMYADNDIETVFDFLDEETSFARELVLMNGFPKLKFGKAMAAAVLK
jgi:lycopene beta-cyclase